jgi:cytochrome c oxidase subunit 3
MAQAGNTHDAGEYYFPHGSRLPFFGSASLFVLMAGAAATLNGASAGGWVLGLGFVLLFTLFFLWFGEVIRENQAGLYNEQVDRSFRMGMMWFIFSEVMFFAAFFGALFYARQLSITSGLTITIAHHALKSGHRGILKVFLAATFLLGFVFLGVQIMEYGHAWNELGLQLGTGIYGSTFFMLTGFHGLHVLVGAIMLTVIWLRAIAGHFTPRQHFAFEAVAWYWHFVDVVWLGLFIFVYWL